MVSARVVLLIVSLVFCTHLRASEVACIGKSDNPSKDFYAKKLDALIEYTQNAKIRLEKLKAKNNEIDKRIQPHEELKNELTKSFNFAGTPEAKKEIAKLIAKEDEKIKKLNSEKEANFNSLPMSKALRQKNETNPENYLDYHGINEINQHLRELNFISAWWSDQGLENSTKTNTSGGVCENCQSPIVAKIQPYIQNLEKLISVPKLKEDCISKSIEYKKAENAEIMCDNSDSKRGSTQNICVTQSMANYTQWALNKAFDCLGSTNDPIDPQIIFKKLNNESSFRFFYSYNGGQGLMQTITCAQDEVLGLSPSPYCGAKRVKKMYRSQARKALADRMNKNSNKCSIYKGIINYPQEAAIDDTKAKSNSLISQINKMRKDDPRYKGLKSQLDKNNEIYNKEVAQYPLFEKRLFNPNHRSTCDFVSLQDGIHRNVLSGLGLYLYYRDVADEDLTTYLGANIKKHPQYKKLRDLTALVYYGPAGPGGAKIRLAKMIPGIKAKFRNLNKMTPKDFEKKLHDNFKYIRAINKSEKIIDDKVDGDKIQCIE
jgi:hypothetical protein